MAETYYAWNPVFDCITKETDAAGATIAEYTQEPKLYGGLISQHRSGTSSFYHYDAVGTTRALTDSSQTVTDTAVYTAFGEKTASVGTTVNPFTYVGATGYFESNLSIGFYVRTRDYSAVQLIWKSRLNDDHMVVNNYVYCNNRPVFCFAPQGQLPIADEIIPGAIVAFQGWGAPIWISPGKGKRRDTSCDKCGFDVTTKLTDVYGKFRREFARHMRGEPHRTYAKNACLAIASYNEGLIAWDTLELAWEKWRFSSGNWWQTMDSCGKGVCHETVTVNRDCYRPEEVNYYLWGMACRLCSDNGFGSQSRWVTTYRCSTGGSGYSVCYPVQEYIVGVFTQEWAVQMVENYRFWFRLGYFWPSATKGRVEWTKVGYTLGELKAPEATVSKLYGLNSCTACSTQYDGPFHAGIGAGTRPWYRGPALDNPNNIKVEN